MQSLICLPSTWIHPTSEMILAKCQLELQVINIWFYCTSKRKQPWLGGIIASLRQACHNGRFWMKISVRTSFSSIRLRTSSVRPSATAFTPRTRIYSRISFYSPWTHHYVHTKNRVCTNAHQHPRRHNSVRTDVLVRPRKRPLSAQMPRRVRTDATLSTQTCWCVRAVGTRKLYFKKVS